jgi:hypothetical protein
MGGIVVGFVLAVLSICKVDLSGSPRLQYRKPETFVSYTRLLVTQRGFDLGSTAGGQDTSARFAGLAVIYSNLVTSDPVMSIMRRQGPVRGSLQAAAVEATPGSEDYLPIISIAGFADTPPGSLQLAQRASNALRTYITQQQVEHNVRDADRVLLRPLNVAGGTKLFAPRKKTLAIVIFLTVMLASVGLALVLENLRPRTRTAGDRAVPLQPYDSARRTAS